MEIYKEIANGYRIGELDRIEEIKSKHNDKNISEICNLMTDGLNCDEVKDSADLVNYTKALHRIQTIASFIYDTRKENSCIWAEPLLLECYKKLGISVEGRKAYTRKGIHPLD